MSVRMKRFALFTALLMFACLATPVVATTADSNERSRPVCPTDYNEYDVSKVRAFLEITDEAGVRNGELLSSDYDPDDPDTWGYDFMWTDDGYLLGFMGAWYGLVGRLDLSGCSKLMSLYVSDNLLTEIDISNCADFKYLTCSNNMLESLNLTNCPQLNYVTCDSNPLSGELVFSDLPALSSLAFSYNELAGLTLNNLPELTSVYCDNNELINLTITNTPKLSSLFCYKNQLTSLDLSGAPALTRLGCSRNAIESLNIALNSELTDLYCDYNQLDEIDVSNCTNLIGFGCTYNRLASLNVEENTALLQLECSGNPLGTLDVSANTLLERLYCANAGLLEIDLSANTLLEQLTLDDNRLTTLDLRNNEALEEISTAGNQLNAITVSSAAMGISDTTIASASGGSVYVDREYLYTDWNTETEIFSDFTAHAVPMQGYGFAGWYDQNGALVGANNAFVFNAETPLSLVYIEARYDVLLGEVNGDGIVNSDDVLSILRYALGLQEFTPSQIASADATGEGIVSIEDALLIFRMLLAA